MDFKEYMVRRNLDIKNVLITLAAYIAAVVIGLIVFPYLAPLGGIALLVAVGLVYLAYHFTSRLKKEFEYILTDDNLDVDVIMNKSRRKRLLSFTVAQLEMIASVNDAQYNNVLSGNFDKKIDATSRRKDADVYFAVVEKGGRTLLTFEPPKEMLEMMQKYARSKIHL